MFKPLVMVHDPASDEVRNFMEKVWTGKDLTVWETPTFQGRNGKKAEKLTTYVIEDTKLPVTLSKEHVPVVMYGHGSWHHYTYGLCAHIAKPHGKFLYCQLDYHADDSKAMKPYRSAYTKRKPDRNKIPRGAMELHCAAFVCDIKDHGASEWTFGEDH